MPARSRSIELALAVLICLGAWYWVRGVFVPTNTAQAQAKGRPIGDNCDLYPYWYGTHELLINHRDPYAADVTREVQIVYYGRPLDPNRPDDPLDKQGFAYPVYTVFLLWPTIQMRFYTVRLLAGWAVLAFVAASVPLWIRALGLRVSLAEQATVVFLIFGTYPLIQAYYLRQLTVLVAILIAAAAAEIAYKRLILGGLLLALATIKPQLPFPLIVCCAIWVLGAWRERWRLAASFSAAMILLIAAGEVVLPGWITQFMVTARAYQHYGAAPSLFQSLVGTGLGIALSVLFGVAVLVVAWHARREPFDSAAFGIVIAAAMALNIAALPKLAPYNQVLLVPAGLIWWFRRGGILTGPIVARALWRSVGACLLWQWVSPALLDLFAFGRPNLVFGKISGLPLYTLYPLPVLLTLAFAWPAWKLVRARALRPAEVS